MNTYYILKDKKPVPCDIESWSRWFGTSDRTVAKTWRGEVLVSTVFLGMNHNFVSGSPLLFETMIFGGEHDQYQERCSTWEEAEAMHLRACAKLGAVK